MLTQVDDNIWYAQGVGKLIGAKSDNKMFIIRNNKHDLLIISPLEPTVKLREEIERLGKVSLIVSPNPFHNIYLLEFWSYYKDAHCVASPGLKKRKPYIFDHIKDFRFDLFDSFPQVELFLYSYKKDWKEIIFFHSPTGSLLLTDLCFNLYDAYGWFGAKLMLKFHGIYRRFAVSRLIKLITGNKDEARSIVAKILKLPIRRILVNHGKSIEDDCHDHLKNAFSWLK